MSTATDLRQFLLDDPDITINQICQNYVPELAKRKNGFIWYSRSNTDHARTFGRTKLAPDSQFFDIEIYHPDIEVCEANADAIQDLDCYLGSFGDGRVQALFIAAQSDDYVANVQFTDDTNLENSFLSIEIRAYTAPVGS